MRRKKRTVDEISATPEAQAVRRAVKLIGGAAATGSIVDPPRCAQAVQKWTETPSKMTPQDARAISKATGHRIPVSDMLPEVYAGLTVQELGYLPAAYTEQKP